MKVLVVGELSDRQKALLDALRDSLEYGQSLVIVNADSVEHVSRNRMIATFDEICIAPNEVFEVMHCEHVDDTIEPNNRATRRKNRFARRTDTEGWNK